MVLPRVRLVCLGATFSPYDFPPPDTTLTSPGRLYVPAVTTYWWRKCSPASCSTRMESERESLQVYLFDIPKTPPHIGFLRPAFRATP